MAGIVRWAGEKVTVMSLRQDRRTRRCISWLALSVAGAEVIVAAASTAAHLPEPYSPGWLGFAFEMPVLVVPLIVVGVALRSCRRGIAMTTAVIALLLALYSAAVLLGHAFWGGDWQGYSAAEKILDLLLYAPPAVVCLAALLVELPAVARRPLPR
jgi:hypothetical protein